MAPRQIDTSRLGMVQALRAIAALTVVFGHAQTEALSLVAAKAGGLSTFLVDKTGAGVDLFFVISGFVMVHASQRLFGEAGAAKTFLLRRLFRIVPLYWAVTTLFLLAMLATPALLSSDAPTLVEIVKSYLFVPYAKAGAEMMQPVYKLGWTLNYEMFFYGLFGLVIWMPLERAVAGLAALLCGCVLMGLALQPDDGIAAFWTRPIILEFGAGALLATLRLNGLRIYETAAFFMAATGVVWLVLVPVASDGSGYEIYRPLLWGAPALLMVAAATLTREQEGKSLRMQVAVLLGDASYSIYLLHPMVIRAVRIGWDKAGLGAWASPWAFVAVILLVTVAVSILAYRLFEKPLTKRLQATMRPDAPFQKAGKDLHPTGLRKAGSPA